MDDKGKRARRLYRCVYSVVWIASFGGLLAAVLTVWPPVRGQPLPDWLQLAMYALFVLASVVASRAGRAVCKARGLPLPDWRTQRVLEPIEPEVQVPDPPPVSYSAYLPWQRRALSWSVIPIIALFGTGAVGGWNRGDWLMAILGTLGTPFWMWVAWTMWKGRGHDDVEADERGLWNQWMARFVPWPSVRGGHLIEDRNISGELRRQQLRLENERGRCVWATEVKDLPPDTRENLFAWVRARTGLR